MKTTRLEGLSTWAEFQAERGIDFNGYHLASAAGGILIDPMPLTPEQQTRVKERGGVRWIVITSAEHLRAGPALARVFDAQVLAAGHEKGRLGEQAQQVDQWFETTSDLPAELQPHLEVLPLRGGKSPMEPALHLKNLQALYFGDVVRSHVSGVLRLLPPEKMSDAFEVQRSLLGLASMAPEAILLGDGDSLYTGAADAFERLLATFD
jgi:hypothetical protein